MDPIENKVTLTKPNAYITSLLHNANDIISTYSRYNAVAVENVITAQAKRLDELESLEKSKRFFLEEYEANDRDNYINQIDSQITSMRNEIATMPNPQPIGQLHQTYPLECEKGLMILINDLRLFFQVDNMISTEGIKSLCGLIIGEYPGVSLEEITVCFAQAKKGYYGEVFNRLDGAIILKWLKVYNAERVERIKLMHQEKHIYSKGDIIYRQPLPTASEELNIAKSNVEIQKATKIIETEKATKK